MIVERGWTDDPHTLLEYRVVRLLEAGELKDADDIAIALGVPAAEVQEVFAQLIDRELADHSPLRMSDRAPHDAYLTTKGRAQARGWTATDTPARRREGCTAAMLAWLNAIDGSSVSSTDALAKDVRGSFFGDPFCEDLMQEVARELKDRELIRGISAWGGAVMRPEITPLGRGVLAKYKGDLATWEIERGGSRGDTITITGSTGVNLASRSPGAQQSVEVTIDARDKLENLAAALEAMYPEVLGLGAAEMATAAGLVVQLREAAEVVGTEPGRARRLLETLKEIAVSGTGSAAGSGLVALAESLGQLLP